MVSILTTCSKPCGGHHMIASFDWRGPAVLLLAGISGKTKPRASRHN